MVMQLFAKQCNRKVDSVRFTGAPPKIEGTAQWWAIRFEPGGLGDEPVAFDSSTLFHVWVA